MSYVPSDFWQGLRRLTRYRYHLARDLAREKLRFQATAFLKCSEWQRVKPFADCFGATSLALLTEVTRAERQALSQLELAERIARYGRGRFDDPAATARAVQDALRTSYPIDPQLDALLTTTLALSAEQLRMIQRLIKRLDQQIARAIAPFPNPLLTVKGLGPVITAGLLAEIVDVTRFPDDPQLAQYIGLTWEKHASGRFVSQNARLTKVGNVYLRYYTILGADRLRQFNLEYQAYYWRKYHEVPKHQHKRALVLTARKLPMSPAQRGWAGARASDLCPAHQECALHRETSDASTPGRRLDPRLSELPQPNRRPSPLEKSFPVGTRGYSFVQTPADVSRYFVVKELIDFSPPVF